MGLRFPPRSMAFGAERKGAQTKPVLVRGAAYWEAEGLKVTPPPLTGHMTQDPRDPCQWTWDMASMALLSQDMMLWSLWKL